MNENVFILFIALIIIGFIVFIYWGGDSSKKGNVITITEHGTRYEQGNSMRRENYVVSPNTDSSVSQYPVYAYNPRDPPGEETGQPGILTWNSATQKCPDGTLDCLYYERVENGRVTKITDKDGNDLIKKFVDDLYADNLESFDELSRTLPDRARLDEDGRLYVNMDGGEKEVIPGEDLPMSWMIIYTSILHKLSGKPKPVFKLDFPAKTQAQLMEMNRGEEPEFEEPEFEEPEMTMRQRAAEAARVQLVKQAAEAESIREREAAEAEYIKAFEEAGTEFHPYVSQKHL